jgi:hypothetical protein
MSSIVKFWKGEIPLSRSFWLYGVAGFIVICVVTVALKPATLNPNALVVGLGGLRLIYVLALAILVLVPQMAYQAFASVGIWRSAEVYQGSAIRPFLCRLALSLAIAWTVSEVAMAVVAFTPELRQSLILGTSGIFAPH